MNILLTVKSTYEDSRVALSSKTIAKVYECKQRVQITLIHTFLDSDTLFVATPPQWILSKPTRCDQGTEFLL